MKTEKEIYPIYDELKHQGIISNQCEFSRLCGRTPMWFSAIKSRNLPISIGALVTLANNIEMLSITNGGCPLKNDQKRFVEQAIDQARQQAVSSIDQQMLKIVRAQ